MTGMTAGIIAKDDVYRWSWQPQRVDWWAIAGQVALSASTIVSRLHEGPEHGSGREDVVDTCSQEKISRMACFTQTRGFGSSLPTNAGRS